MSLRTAVPGGASRARPRRPHRPGSCANGGWPEPEPARPGAKSGRGQRFTGTKQSLAPQGAAMTAMSRVVVGVSGSPGCLPAVRYAAELARAHRAPLIPVLAWQPPGGDLADRSHPSPALRDLWAEAAGRRLQRTLLTAFGVLPSDVSLQPHVVR